MLPSLNGLRAFDAAARHLSFTRAAAELNVTQTAISHQIRRLEAQLGVRLFVRRNRALLLLARGPNGL
jgi:LysR family transcriptional regulator, glycine cleavage system transcriptional activator